MKQDKIKDLVIEELSDMLNAEEQIIKALPAMVKAADSPELKDAFETHLEETHEHVDRLKKVFGLIRAKPTGERCKAMEGLINECKEVIEEFDASPLRDAALIAKAQRIEHYEISTYGTLKSFAKQMDLPEVHKLLEETSKQEAHADKLLTKIAEGGLLTAGINSEVNE